MWFKNLFDETDDRFWMPLNHPGLWRMITGCIMGWLLELCIEDDWANCHRPRIWSSAPRPRAAAPFTIWSQSFISPPVGWHPLSKDGQLVKMVRYTASGHFFKDSQRISLRISHELIVPDSSAQIFPKSVLRGNKGCRKGLFQERFQFGVKVGQFSVWNCPERPRLFICIWQMRLA